MYHNHSHNKYERFDSQLSNPYFQSRNAIDIKNTNFIWDRKKKRLILIIETRDMLEKEILAHLKGNKLYLEAYQVSPYERPFRTHLIDRELKDEFEEGIRALAFSEIKLKSRYHYRMISYQAMSSNLIKVILQYT